METVKINSFELENVKRVKAVKLAPSENGLTIIGGNNNQGKTSILDAIAWAVGGNKFKPSQANREDSVLPPSLQVTLSNGLVVERKGKNSDLKILDPQGRKTGQNLLDEFIEELALNLPKFMNASNKTKADILLQIIGVGEQLAKLELEEKKLYEERLMTGRLQEQKQKYSDELAHYEEVPKTPISPSELIKQQQEILARNGENQRKRQEAERYKTLVENQRATVERIAKQFEEEKLKLTQFENDLAIAQKSALALVDESTEELEQNIANIETINIKVRANLEKEKASEEAKVLADKYTELTNQIEEVRKEKYDLLNNANLPLQGLSVEDGELTYNGMKWDNMSGSEQLIVATSIVRKLKPNCGFVLIDKLEQMDLDTLQKFSQWLEKEDLQAIGTRVSKGDECSIIIEDGYAQELHKTEEKAIEETPQNEVQNNWKW